ncbi:putative ABC efflux transporter [Aspergillus clavatus NRRL 1]|uniref:ABC transporter, putative n=1 Tax=Aspergillus clavatus (strain ATCC 1007 / CBS 513.65 / DSM 816 / NCTC 3887 / NRRL 1 / QM 1276 / 107) TaxID=344612 RepID=A1CK63_ASPCL|nr:ABC transporter, putative [Aspergillus clavatus NRRL 1]EAW09537.1 ABC transporter, putative [Aspergillus clavatus NRRL 1]
MEKHEESVTEVTDPKEPGFSTEGLQDHTTAFNLSLRAVNPVDVCVNDLSLEVDTTPPIWETPPSQLWQRLRGQKSDFQTRKTVLDGVSAAMPSGSLTAIIGSSGSGKTSLLNLMAGRMSLTKAQLSGTTTFNGVAGSEHIRTAYVMQEDVLIPTLTVRETLRYSADLRLPPPATQAERREIVEQVILELGLKECADTRIGTSTHKGCSGGEKRRASIGVQMLANPSVLYCDEPTTGLDATSAFQIIRTLKRLAEDGRTVIVSIHAPRSEIWSLFDNVILLARGSVLYSGPVRDSLSYFETCGHVLPPFVNPAEFLIDLAAIDNRAEALEAASTARVELLKAAWKSKRSEEKQPGQNPDERMAITPGPVAPISTAVSFGQQFRVLTSRTFTTTIRDPLGMAGSLLEAVGMAVINGWIFLQLDESQAGIRSRQGSLYTASSLNGYLILLYETYRLTIDIRLFDRERNEGVVSVPAFLLSRRAARLPLEDLPVPVIFALIYYFMVGYRLSVGQFFIFLTLTILTHYIAVTFAAVSIGVARSFPGASLVGNLSFTLQSFACGYFVQSNQIPVYVRWLKWVAYTFYIFGALCANEFIGPDGPPEGQFYDCPFSKDPLDPACTQYTGRYIMENLGFPSTWIWRPIVILVAFAVGHYLLAGVLLQYNRFAMDIAQARKTDIDLSSGKEKTAERRVEEARPVTITLDKYALEIRKRQIFQRRARTLPILKPISADFQPGKLNVIMGPSGSGKTSLLNSVARRLRGSLGTQYRLQGDMLYNGGVPSAGVIRSVTSFVTQDDDALMPSLTVRESLRFAAGLRLPQWMTREQKNQRAEEILLKMGLKECADNLIGSELIKGISGGEKRRVTIAIQILTDPKVLLLDEPTSGLDAFTATSIIEVLKALAAEGRTLIMTIHQSRSDLFQHFSSVLLLARGGYPVYAGEGEKMLPYFRLLGYECPQTTNPADFVLDLITVDLQQEDREALTRERVQKLIASWDDQGPELGRRPSQIATPAELGSLKRQMLPFRITYPLVLHRAAINFWRQPPLVMARSMQVVGIAIIMALFFAPLKNDYAAVQSRMGFIQEFAALYFVGMLQNIAIYPNERDVFYREEADNCYSAETFILQYTTLEVPFEAISSLIFGVLAAYADNLDRSAKMFLISAFNCFCIINCGESVGIMFCTVFSHVGFAVNITSILLSISTILGGVMSLNVNEVLQAINHLSPIKYAIANLAPYALHGQEFTCTAAQRLADGTCPIQNGQQVLQLYNLDKNAAMNVMALGVCTIIYRVVAYLMLKVLREGFWRRLR